MINSAALHMLVPDYPLDQIIGIFTGTLSIPAPTLGGQTTTTTDVKPYGFGDSCYFQGIFTTNGGTTYNDFGAQTPNLATPTQPVLQTVDCQATSSPTGLTVTVINYYDNVHGAGTAYTLSYKVFLLAKNTMAQPLNPLPTNQKLSFSSQYNFQRIAKKDTLHLTVAAGNTGSVSAIHGLGFIPDIRAFRFNSATPTISRPLASQTAPRVDTVQAQLTDQLVTFYSDQSSFLASGVNADIQYRLYLK